MIAWAGRNRVVDGRVVGVSRLNLAICITYPSTSHVNFVRAGLLPLSPAR